jgi:MFS family permease
MAFSGPFEIAVTSAIVNWFIEKRGRAMSFATFAHSIGLTVLPILAFVVIDMWNWRVGWFAIGVLALLIGVIPNALFMIRRPEDIGLRPYRQIQSLSEVVQDTINLQTIREHGFTRHQAYRTPMLWILMAFSAFIYPVQAGVSLHQAPLLIAKGLTPGIAAIAVGSFSLMAAIAGLAFGQLETRFGVYRSLAVAALFMTIGTALMLFISTAWTAFLSAIIFGAGIGGLLTLLPVAWANSFGREHLGSIRGITMPVQILAQASGPLISGALFDKTGTYDASLVLYFYFAIISSILALVAIKFKPSNNKH